MTLDSTATQASRPHDPATWRNVPAASVPLDRGRIESLLAAEWERFSATTPASAEHNIRASKSLPLGVTSSFQHWDPYPISIASAKGAWLTDVDGRQLLDLSMGFGAMLLGHLNPVMVDHVTRALTETGTLFVTPVAHGDARRGAVPAALRPGQDAVHELRHGVDDVRRPHGARVHAPPRHRQDRGRLPRRIRRPRRCR